MMAEDLLRRVDASMRPRFFNRGMGRVAKYNVLKDLPRLLREAGIIRGPHPNARMGLSVQALCLQSFAVIERPSGQRRHHGARERQRVSKPT